MHGTGGRLDTLDPPSRHRPYTTQCVKEPKAHRECLFGPCRWRPSCREPCARTVGDGALARAQPHLQATVLAVDPARQASPQNPSGMIPPELVIYSCSWLKIRRRTKERHPQETGACKLQADR